MAFTLKTLKQQANLTNKRRPTKTTWAVPPITATITHDSRHLDRDTHCVAQDPSASLPHILMMMKSSPPPYKLLPMGGDHPPVRNLRSLGLSRVNSCTAPRSWRGGMEGCSRCDSEGAGWSKLSYRISFNNVPMANSIPNTIQLWPTKGWKTLNNIYIQRKT